MWESFPFSRKNWNGFCKCRKCGKIIYYPILKKVLDHVNGIWLIKGEFGCWIDKQLKNHNYFKK